MTLLGFILVILTAFLFALLGIYFVRRTHQQSLQKRQLRKDLLHRFESLPLPRMFHALGISFKKFFYQVPFENIHESAQICETCPSIRQCKDILSGSEKDPDALNFCPNMQRIHKFNSDKP